MYRRLTRLLLILAFVAAVSYMWYYNPQEATLTFGTSTQVNAPLALLLIASFFLGVISLAMIATWIGLKMQFERWRLNKKMAAQDSHYHDLAVAEDLVALHDSEGAISILGRIISKDPHDILARLALAKTHATQGKFREAIKTLEEARAEQRRSPALLLELADAYESLGNRTAALDNILLALKEQSKSPRLLRTAVRLSKDLGRLDEATTYALELLKVCAYSEQDEIQEILAEIRLANLEAQTFEDLDELKKELQALLRIHKDFEPALIALGQAHFDSNEPEKAIKSLKRALHKKKSTHALQLLISHWVSHQDPNSAIKLLNDCISEAYGLEIPARALLVQLQLKLENLDAVEVELEKLEEEVGSSPGAHAFLSTLRARFESRMPGRAKSYPALEILLAHEAKLAGFPYLPLIAQATSNNEESLKQSVQGNLLVQ